MISIPAPHTALKNFDSFWQALQSLLALPPESPPAPHIPEPGDSSLEQPLQLSLQQLLGETKITYAPEDRRKYGEGMGYDGFLNLINQGLFPSAVVYPESEQEIALLMLWAGQREIQLLPWGGGGAPYRAKSTPQGAFLAVDLQRMNRILDLDTEQRRIRLQAGVRWQDLHSQLTAWTTGQVFPFDEATVGGSLATSSIGTQSLGYGTLIENTPFIKAVCPTGPLELMQPAAFSSDLRGMMLGSQGAWGFITEVSLRIFPQPQEKGLILASFMSRNEALEKLRTLLRSGVPLSAARIVDAEDLLLFNASPPPSLGRLLRSLRGNTPAWAAHLILEIHGSREAYTTTRQYVDEWSKNSEGQIALGPRTVPFPLQNWSQRFALIRPLWEQGVLGHLITAVVPWHQTNGFLKDWEEALRSVLLATGGVPGVLLTTVYASPQHALIYTLLFGRQASGDPPALQEQLDDIQAVALETKRRWGMNTEQPQLIQHTLQCVAEVLDPLEVILR
ncbi:MAG: FAD-binding protein [Anaerolineae bacterium]|nr:FAD-binding protein [Anaerolineae bacterium]